MRESNLGLRPENGWSVPPSSGACGAISFVYVEDGAKKEKVESVIAVKKNSSR